MIFGKSVKTTQWETILNKECQAIKQLQKKSEVGFPPPQINSKWIKGINVKPKTAELLKENPGGKSAPRQTWQGILKQEAKTARNTTKEKTIGFTKVKPPRAPKDNIKKVSKHMKTYRTRENILHMVSNNGLESKIYSKIS